MEEKKYSEQNNNSINIMLDIVFQIVFKPSILMANSYFIGFILQKIPPIQGETCIQNIKKIPAK